MRADQDSRIPQGLIVSCQPVPGGPLDNPDSIVRLALAARDGGANGVRIEGAVNVAAVAKACSLPIVGIVKRDLEDSPIRITPFAEDVARLANAGATIVAVDATARRRPVPVEALLHEIHSHGCVAMADIATIEEAQQAARTGFDIVATTLSGYTGGPVPDRPDLNLVRECAALGKAVIAEGRYNSPQLAAQAMEYGADAVCVGSAITRTEHVTGWYVEAIRRCGGQADPVLALDVGGTKTLVALVRKSSILEQRTIPTARAIGAADWFAQLKNLVSDWNGRYARVGAAMTGLIANGQWSALNPETLPIPSPLPLNARLEETFGVPVSSFNDAQAAAWGEYRFGAGKQRDLIFLTISSGIGGGIVSGGRLMVGARGLAGSLGQTLRTIEGERLESTASGFGMARTALRSGRSADAKAIFAARARGEAWASDIVAEAAREIAAALTNLQALIDPEVILLGGGVGRLADFQEQLSRELGAVDPQLRPLIESAGLGAESGLLGAADLACARVN